MDGSAVHPDVTVLAGTAAAALYDVSAGFSWEDANPSPYGFGGMSADFAHDFYSNGSFSGQVINKVMLPNDVLSFSITTSQVITGPLRVQGLAGALLPASYDGAGRSVTFTKSENFGFEMATPEPGTWATLGGGVILLLGLARRRRAHAVNS